ncbi:PREDICTED: uncharacterized protein LOC109477364 [Branchiostoma belcheri]|uniref:Uncharacterized protein LOC109477364 n=1 Tax=Branchiostoma belcheri TaxID=7741 RepID=A0A6P4ZJC5_BRABE|nr:PREDICTED: uncharacterized protein LOC109477364 [Branchiostoma belcheri]
MAEFSYTVSGSGKIRELESELQQELEDLKADIEENELLSGQPNRSISSVPWPKSHEHFCRERQLAFDKALQVTGARPLLVQAEVLQEEMEGCLKKEYTAESLPLLLHQFYLDRIQELVQCKHMHMLRWKRFCRHTNVMETMYPHYHSRLDQIMGEYRDALERAQRLSVVREALLAGNPAQPCSQLTPEDLQIYLRWLTCHLHSIRKICAYVKVLQWLPATYKSSIAPPPLEADGDEDGDAIVLKHQREDPTPGIHVPSPGRRSPRPLSGVSVTSAGRVVPPAIPASMTSMPGSSLLPEMAAAGGGLASNQTTLGLPLHLMDFEDLRPLLEFLLTCYNISMDMNQIVTSADEMELFSHVNRKFKTLFNKQEQYKTFPTYDRVEAGADAWGADKPSHSLRKDCPWRPFVRIRPQKEPFQQKMMTKLRQENNIDELLRAQCKFLEVPDVEKVLESLREHAIAVRDPPPIIEVSVTSHRSTQATNTQVLWQKIYTNPELDRKSSKEDELDLVDIDEKNVDNVDLTSKARTGSGRKRQESYDYGNTMQMLGLDEGDDTSHEPSVMQGAYLSFLYLRHLRLRDLKRSCLSILNYFCSVERTLTINERGLSLEAGHLKSSNQSSAGIGSHHYVHNTPADYRLNEMEFMEFSDIENHDDFYTYEEGRIHVQDQRGFYVMYDHAIDALRELEHDLLLVASHFIEKDKENRELETRTGSALRRQQSVGGVNLSAYGHVPVDRFAVLLDLWTNEAMYLESKRQLLDCYLEAYHHVFDTQEKQELSAVMTTVMNQRPRIDFTLDYFVKTYRAECVVLRLQAQLVKSVLDKQIEEQRDYVGKLTEGRAFEFGLPPKIIPKQPVAINFSKPALKHVYMLEFHPSLGVASRIPQAINHAFWELIYMNKASVKTSTQMISLEHQILEAALKEWEKMEPLGAAYSPQLQADMFSDIFVDNPAFLCEIGNELVSQEESAGGQRRTAKERRTTMLNVWSKLLEVVTVRHRLLEAAWESSILSTLYKQSAFEMGFDEYHTYLRMVQFEFASRKENIDTGPIFITAVMEDESIVDRYLPGSLPLAIHELDEKHLGMFSFRTKEAIVKLMTGTALDNLQVVLLCQVVHKNALLCAVQQANVCWQQKDFSKGDAESRSGTKSPTETLSLHSSLTATTAVSAGGGLGVGSSASAFAAKLRSKMDKEKRSPEAFISLQLEKAPCRDLMLNEFLQKKTAMSTILKNPEEVAKLKRSLLTTFCQRFHQRVLQYSLRSQIIAYINSLVALLEEFPDIKENYFLIGTANERKTDQDDVQGLIPDARVMKKRPRRILTADGASLVNLWFIPHHSEVLVMFKSSDEETCTKALRLTLRIVSMLHDICHYLCAHSKLGSNTTMAGSEPRGFVTAEWGGVEGIGADLREIQKQLEHLPDPQDPHQVADFLQLRRDVMFLEFDAAIRHCIRHTFLTTGNTDAYRAVTDNMQFGLGKLSSELQPSLYNMSLPLPQPLQATDAQALELFPWRTFQHRFGPFPGLFPQWHQIEHNMQLCLAGLTDVDRAGANGEILGVSLLMEDILVSGSPGAISMERVEDSDDEGDQSARKAAEKGNKSRPMSSISGYAPSVKSGKSEAPEKKPLSRREHPLEAHQLLKDFLLLWKRLEAFKQEWGERKLAVSSLENPRDYRLFCKMYKAEIHYPVLRSLARRLGQGDDYDGMVSDDEPLVMPKGASEFETRVQQLLKLLDNLECHMIYEVRKKISKEHGLVLNERGREETALPTDLWKRPAMKESFTIAKPHLVEDFSQALMSSCQENGTSITFSKEHLQTCLSQLASAVMGRERTTYESYTMFYENLLRQYHQLMYQKEQELKHCSSGAGEPPGDSLVEVQCQLADRYGELILEITALRAKVAEMREMTFTQERDIREQVKCEYDELVEDLFSSQFELMKKFDDFRLNLHDILCEKVAETRVEADDAISKLKQREGGVPEDEIRARNMRRAAELRALQHENSQLSRVLSKSKAMVMWKSTKIKGDFHKSISELQKEVSKNKKECLQIKMNAEEEVILLRQQQLALRKALQQSEQEYLAIKKKVEQEEKEKKEREHMELQRARSKKQLESAKTSNIEKLLDELEDKDQRLRHLTEEQEKTSKLSRLSMERAEKTVSQIKSQLDHERNLKLDAFQRVDELQAQVYDFESGVVPRPYTANTTVSRQTSTRTPQPRVRSGKSRSSGFSDISLWPTSSGPLWPPAAGPGPIRSLTPGPPAKPNGVAKLQRPKTVTGRLKSRIAESLIAELERSTEDTLVQLQQLQHQK